jgi:hypothetical protein
MKMTLQILIYILIGLSLTSCGQSLNKDTRYIVEDERNAVSENEEVNSDDSISEDRAEPTHLDSTEDTLSSEVASCEGTSLLKDVIVYGDMIKNLGGQIEAPLDYDDDFVGFQKFLTNSGVINFSAIEVGTPGSMSKAKECSLKHLIPNRACWLRVTALLLTGDKIRDHLDSKVAVTSLFRPTCYNKKVKGTKNSDHLTARSMDITFYSKEKRKKAADFICDNFWKDDLYNLSPEMSNASQDETLNISIGLGGTYMHIGLSSPHGRRYWVYNSYVKGGGQSNTCWNRP